MSTTIRRGLPRETGGQGWPPKGTPTPPVMYTPAALDDVAPVSSPAPAAPAEESTAPVAEVPAALVAEAPAPAVSTPTFRQGLPRVAGGGPWPPADAAPEGMVAGVASAAPAQPVAASEQSPDTTAEVTTAAEPEAHAPAPTEESATDDAAPVAASTTETDSASGQARLGLPRVAGEDSWPPAGTMVTGAFNAASAAAAPGEAPSTQAKPKPEAQPEVPAEPAAPAEPVKEAPSASPTPAAQPAADTSPKPAAPTPPATPAREPVAASTAAPAKKEPAKKYGPFTIKQWVGASAVIALAIVGAVTLVVLFARWFTSLEFMQSFLTSYPGEYDLPESAPVGFPGWLGWQHFFNIFLMVLIIRSGILVRQQERPEAFWASKKNPKKISIQLWLHQSLNLLWIVNGAIFIILLFVSGQWMRVIPTSFEVFPNALSAGLQYLTLDWPLDNGWVNYNSLQQLAYFATIFIAAPLSAITGYRMSESWPRESKLSDKFPVEWARKLHFPLMIYFVGFIVVHVALVFTTGALRNLNHMFAAQGSTDPSVYAANWTGFWLFILSMVFVAGTWIAARPMIMAPIARIFGNVSAR